MADLSVSNFPNEVTTPANTDLFYISHDLGGSFESKRITWANIVAAIGGADGNGIYEGSGSLTAATTVTMDGNNLSFSGDAIALGGASTIPGTSVSANTFSSVTDRLYVNANGEATVYNGDAAVIVKQSGDTDHAYSIEQRGVSTVNSIRWGMYYDHTNAIVSDAISSRHKFNISGDLMMTIKNNGTQARVGIGNFDPSRALDVLTDSLTRAVRIVDHIGTVMASIDGSLAVGGTTPNTNAILDVQSTSKGLLIPRMTGATLVALTTDGLIGYATSTSGAISSVGFWGYENGGWVKL